MVVLADQSAEFIGLGRMRDRNAAGVKVTLETSV